MHTPDMPTINKSSPRRPWQPERKAHERRTMKRDGFYHTPEWRRAREVAMLLNMDSYGLSVAMCVICMEKEIYTPATVVDHIQRRTPRNRALWLDQSNLQCVCASCHNRKSGREAHEKKEA